MTQGGETLLDIARERNLGVPEISAVNPGVDPWVPAAETLLTLPTQFILPDAPRTGHRRQLRRPAALPLPKDGSVETYAIGVGRDGFELKFGQTKIVRKKEQPTWYPTESTLRDKPWVGTVVPPGPDNPLGDYAMYLGWPTYVIHGTNKPYGVGRRVSRGCIRMYPEGVERLFAEIPVGTPVTAVDQVIEARLAHGRALSRGPARFRPDRRAGGEPGHQAAASDRRGPPTDSSSGPVPRRRGSTGRWPRPNSSSARGMPVQITTAQLRA